MKKKLFVLSDVHGHFEQMVQALRAAGFDPENEEHYLLSCGDLFDRGSENGQVYEYLRSLSHKILLRGNHEDLLRDALLRGYINEVDRANKTDLTLRALLPAGGVDEEGVLDQDACAPVIEEIVAFLDAMGDFYETDRYVFTHGWLPCRVEGRHPSVLPDWRQAGEEEWREAHLLEWQQFYAVGCILEGKTIVCGHRPAEMGRMFDPFREPDCPDPFFGEGIIAIDGYTVKSGRVNVLVIEEGQTEISD